MFRKRKASWWGSRLLFIVATAVVTYVMYKGSKFFKLQNDEPDEG